MKTPECTQRYLHLKGAGASPSDLLVPLQLLFTSFILRSVGPAALITVFDEIKRDIRNSVFHEIFISFPLGYFAASRFSEIEMSQLRFEALPCEITIITMAQHDAIIRDNDNLLRRALNHHNGPARCNHPRQRRFPSSREQDAFHHGWARVLWEASWRHRAKHLEHFRDEVLAPLS